MDPKSSSNGGLGDPWTVMGRLWHPPWSILRGPKNESIFEGSLDRQKSMNGRLWAAWGAKTVLRTFTEDDPFSWLVPRAGLACARLIQ